MIGDEERRDKGKGGQTTSQVGKGKKKGMGKEKRKGKEKGKGKGKGKGKEKERGRKKGRETRTAPMWGARNRAEGGK